MFGNLDMNKSEAMRHIACRDAEEADRVLSREEMERREEAKDNTITGQGWEIHWCQLSRFFHIMANAHCRRNHLARIGVDGVWLSEEQDIKEGVGKASKGLLITIKDSMPILNALSSRSIDQEQDERPFTKEEILQFLSV